MDMMKIINTAASQNPMIKNLVNLLKSGDSAGVETFARNIFKEKGRDFDREYRNFRNTFKF